MLKQNKHIWVIGSIITLALVSAAYITSDKASANPLMVVSSSCVKQTSSVSTSTVNYMTPGVGTTTLTYDSYCGGNNQITDGATLLVYQLASSTVSSVDIAVEYSNDSTDWYENKIDAMVATTTTPIAIGPISNFVYKYSSTTPGKIGVPAALNYGSRIVSLYTPTRYMRIVFSNTTLTSGAGVATSLNTAIWAQIVPNKESK